MAGREPKRSGESESERRAAGSNALGEELSLALQTLAGERNRFEAVLQTMATAVISLDAKGKVTTVNRSATALFGLPSGIEGRTLLEAVRVPALYELTQRAASDSVQTAEFELPASHRQVQARVSRQVGGGLVIVADDVTEIRHLERVRRDFVANLSHELRTPISVIRANAETLLDGVLDSPDQARGFVEALYRHADRLARLVQELLDISRLEAGKFGIRLEPVEVNELAEDVLTACESEAVAKGVRLQNSVNRDIWASLDVKAAEQVLTNLLDNAIKYTPAGGSVELAAVESGKNLLRFEVRDDGVGIEPQHRVRIFERFYRVDPGRSREMGGTGLGLSIVKHLVDAMGGQVGVDSRRPRGSVFWFTAARVEPPTQ